MLEKTKIFLIYLFLFFLSWQTRLIWRAGELNGGYWEYGTISVYAIEIILWLAASLSLIMSACTKNQELRIKNQGAFGKLILKTLLLTSYFLLLSFFALRKDIHFYYLFRFAEGAGLYFLIKSVDRQKAAWAFILGMVPQALLGIWQFLTQSSFASKWLGMALHDPSALGTFVVETVSGRWLRAYGGMPHPNILGAYLVVALFILVSQNKQDSSEESRIKNQELSHDVKSGSKSKYRKIKNFTSYFLLLTFGTALFFTFSRSAWVALFIGLFVYWFVYPSSPPLTRGGRVGLSSLLSVIMVFLILVTIFHEPVLSRLQNQNRLEVKSQIERVGGYEEAWQIIRHHPLTGIGLGSYTYAVWKEIDPSRPSYVYQPVHNIFVLLLVEIGILGILLVSVFLFYTFFKNSISHYALFIILILGLFDHYLLTLYPGVMLLFLISSLIKNPPN